MNIRIARLNRLSAVACAAAITAVGVWAFLNSTASIGRDPFQFAAVLATNAKLRAAQVVVSQIGPEDVRDYGVPDLLAPSLACLGGCS